jgi:hypothetical protein
VRAWLGWRARLEHWLNPGNECLCEICVRIHSDNARLAEEIRDARARIELGRAPRIPPEDYPS